jgi:alpha 1,3-glucosidase
MVAIVDPHVKRTDDYRIYTDAKELDVLVKRADGSEFEGWCWPGSSVWVDFFNPNSWDWWTRMFKMDVWTVSCDSCVSLSQEADNTGVCSELVRLE